MNRYQLEVAEIDCRHRRIVRTCSFIGAGVLAVAAFWNAGFAPSEWWSQVPAWLAPTQQASDAVTPTPPQQPGISVAPTSVPLPTVDVLAGTDSSISSVPKPLFLIATAPGRNRNEGTAQIGTNPDNPQTYIGGAVLANGARLAEIHPDHVILTRDNSSARLELYRRNRPSAPSSNALLNVGGEPQAEPAAVVTRETLTDYVRPSPMYEGEVLRGYEVYAGRKAGIFSRLGLESGDVITAIDDVPLTDPQQSMELIAQLTRGTAIVATIERKKVKQRITLDGSLITADQEQAMNAAAQTPPPMGMPPS